MPGVRRVHLRNGADPLWYKDAIIYEVHVRAFQDSDGDGIGDFVGLTSRLDYLRDLGVTAIWLLPFYPSPLKDDGYDIADYYNINSIYGTLKDFKVLLAQAHERNLRVITELVVNHTSDQHPWFQRSRRAKPGTAWRDFYVWSDTAEKYNDARIIFRDFEHSNWTWDPVANAYFWHRFYGHQPDLNFDSPLVRREISRVLDFWFDLGVDGFRLDAIPYLYEREGTSCENLPETHQYLKSLRGHVDQKYGDRMLLAEANQWPEDAVNYFGGGKGDECHMAFHFPLMPRIFMAVRMEDREPLVDILEQTPAIPETSQWALFLRNHDELTLEMVTDEERDYMYRVYASVAKARINLGIRRRLAPLMGNDRKRIELLHILLLSYPGTPVLYYGDEIAMGDNIFLGDRNGVRTPMQWSSDKNAGFSKASPQALYLPIILDPEYHYEAVNVEAQQANPNSLWWWVKRALALRKQFRAFGRGTIRFFQPENRKILVFARECEGEKILIVANLSRFPQSARVDLSTFRQMIPVELFGRTRFPAITEAPYFFTLTPHAAFWFSLEPAPGENQASQGREEQLLIDGERWEDVLQERHRPPLERALLNYLSAQPWFRGKDRPLKSAQVVDWAILPTGKHRCFLLSLLVEYVEGDPDEYLLPICFASGEDRELVEKTAPRLIIGRARLRRDEQEGVLYEATGSLHFCRTLIETIGRRRSIAGASGELRGVPAAGFRLHGDSLPLPPGPSIQDRGASAGFAGKYYFELLRRIEIGTNPGVEMEVFLARREFPRMAGLAGTLEYHRFNGEHFTVGILHRFVPGAKSGWEFTMDALGRFFDRTRTAAIDPQLAAAAEADPLKLAETDPPEAVVSALGTFIEAARLLGARTAELHLALASDPDDRDFAPEPFTPFYQRSLFQSMRNQAVQTLQFLRSKLGVLDAASRAAAEQVLAREAEILRLLRAVYERRIAARRIRCHGDLHLGKTMHTGKDFIFFKFGGESSRPLGERRIKRSALRDVASVMRSFDYAASASLFQQVAAGALDEARLPQQQAWLSFWQRSVAVVFLRAYLEGMKPSPVLPSSSDELRILLQAHLLEKMMFEVSYELRHRPDWARIPLRAILGWMSATLA